MKLSPRQMALFGQVKVNIMSPDCKLAKYITLLQLYNDGWWVTDRFGTIVTIVKPKSNIKHGFCCYNKRISTTVNLDALDEEIKRIADIKYIRYQNYLERKIKKVIKVNIYENNMSTLPSGNNN